jgi:chemotaxis protein histidine kinase CheA
MQVTAVSLARTMVLAAAMSGIMLSAPPVAAGDDAAHTLADKFSRAAEDAERAEAAKKAEAKRARAAERAMQQRREAEARRKAYEEDMLARARAEAAARQAEAKRLAKERARAEEKQRAEIAARLAKEAEAKRLAKEVRKAEAARLAKKAEEKRLAQERRKAESARLAKQAEDERLAEERRKAAKDRAELEALRAQEARRIVRKFQRAREQRMREAGAKKNGLGGPRPPVAELDDPRQQDESDLRPPVAELDESWPEKDNRQIATKYPARVTVLVLMEPRNRGRRRYKKAAYPVLCVGRRCYISAGAENTANALSRPRVLGPVNSLGRRAGPCNNQLACVFRGVTLDRNPSHIQPVDMGLLRHKRRDIRKAAPDRTCAVTRGTLHCKSVIIAHRYRAWIVPEAIAEEAGPKALEDALHNGLTTPRSARLVSGQAP